MKKATVLVSFLFLVSMVFVVATANADSNAAIVLKDLDHPTGCYYSGVFSTVDQIHTVATSSGVVKLVCQFDTPDGYLPSGKAVHIEGFSCGIYLPTGSLITTDSRIDINKNNATMECWIKLDN